jgi:hypothetical protein
MTPEHMFPEGDGEAVRCIHCGTLREHHERSPQNCVRHPIAPEPLRPEPARRAYAVDDRATIPARIAELRADREAARAGRPEEKPEELG